MIKFTYSGGYPLSTEYTKEQLQEIENAQWNNRKLGIILGGKRPMRLSSLIFRVMHDAEQTYCGDVHGKPGRSQCDAYRMRSLEDLFIVCKTYIPKITLEYLLKCIKKLNESRVTALSPSFCADVQHWVHNKQNTMVDIIEVRKQLGRLNINIAAGEE
jgi:hypothetical protein